MKRLTLLALCLSVVSSLRAEEAPAAAAPTPATVPVATPAEAPVKKEEAKTEAVKAPEPAKTTESAPTNAVSYVAPLQELVDFHEKEIATIQKMMARWNEKLGATVKRRAEMEKDVADMQQKVAELQKESNKKNKNEASRLTKQITRVNKDIKAVDNLLKSQNKELAAEMKEVSKETQTALKDAFQQAINNAQQPRH